MWERYVEPVWNALPTWSQIVDVWPGTKNDWFIAIVGGIIGGVLSVGLVSSRVPKLSISKSIALTANKGRVVARIKVINRRRRWFFLRGDALANKAELHLVKYDPAEENEITSEVELQCSAVAVIPHRNFFRKTSRSEYVFAVKRNPPKKDNKVYRDLPKRFFRGGMGLHTISDIFQRQLLKL